MKNAACLPSLLLALLFLFLHTARCMPVQEVDHRISVTSGVTSGGLSQGRQLVKRDLSINADLHSLATMLMAQQEAEDRRHRQFLRNIGKRDFANMAADSDVMGLVPSDPSDECGDCAGEEKGEGVLEGGESRPLSLALLRQLLSSQ
ncbi:uncharacterized protein [Littorina saxatilis]|uniref:Uncharacterized protein n=1 Tax=Littorina saxatilis TaxID=31220 RepID=A0AAN9ARZ9_9CAEN